MNRKKRYIWPNSLTCPSGKYMFFTTMEAEGGEGCDPVKVA